MLATSILDRAIEIREMIQIVFLLGSDRSGF